MRLTQFLLILIYSFDAGFMVAKQRPYIAIVDALVACLFVYFAWKPKLTTNAEETP